VGTHFLLAECYEKAGKLATAWVNLLDVVSESRTQGRADRAQAAQRRADALATRLTKITIVVSPEARVPGLEVRRDGEVVGEGQWGVALPVDPGPHEIRATAPGRTEFRTSATATNEGKTTTIEVPSLAMLPAAPAPSTPPPAVVSPPAGAGASPPATAAAPAPEPASEPARGLGAQKTIALVAGGRGLVGLGVGGYFGAQALSKHSDSTAHCQGAACDSAGLQLVDDGKSAASIANIGIGAGAALVAGAAILWLTAPSAGARSGSVRAAPVIARDGGGVAVGGAW
jgi:hypothetical protein